VFFVWGATSEDSANNVLNLVVLIALIYRYVGGALDKSLCERQKKINDALVEAQLKVEVGYERFLESRAQLEEVRLLEAFTFKSVKTFHELLLCGIINDGKKHFSDIKSILVQRSTAKQKQEDKILVNLILCAAWVASKRDLESVFLDESLTYKAKPKLNSEDSKVAEWSSFLGKEANEQGSLAKLDMDVVLYIIMCNNVINYSNIDLFRDYVFVKSMSSFSKSFDSVSSGNSLQGVWLLITLGHWSTCISDDRIEQPSLQLSRRETDVPHIKKATTQILDCVLDTFFIVLMGEMLRDQKVKNL